MGMMTIPAANAALDLICNNQAWAGIGDASGLQPSAVDGSLYLSLCTAWPGETPATGQSTNEVSYTGYDRSGTAIARDDTGFSSPAGGALNPAAEVSWGQRSDSGSDPVCGFWILGTAASGNGQALMWGVLANASFGTRTFQVTDPTNNYVNIQNHGLVADDRIAFFATEGGPSLPAGITEGTMYYVLAAVDADTITVSTTSGGSELDITGDGEGMCLKVEPITVSQNVEPRISTTTVLKIT